MAEKRAAGLSANTVRLIRATLSVLLADAMDEGIVTTNPTQELTRKGRRGADTISQSDRRRKIKPLSLAELGHFLAVAGARASHREATLFLMLADTGLRPGEVLALQWQDVDLIARSLTVERALSFGQVKTTKTGESRTVDLTPRLSEALGSWQATVEANALLADHDPAPWVFASDRGAPLDPAQVAQRFRWLLRIAGAP